MISKETVISQLKSLINEYGKEKIESFVVEVNSINDDKWDEFVLQNGVTEKNLIDIIKGRLGKPRFTALNDLINYGTSDETLHIHIAIDSVHHLTNRQGIQLANTKLIQALSKLREMLSERNDTNIKKIFAVSPILRIKFVQDMFRHLEFTVSQTNEEYLLSKFPNAKSVWQAELPVDVLLSGEYDKKLKSFVYEEISKG